MTNSEKMLLSVLRTGEENAILQRDITALTGFSGRVTRQLCENLRKSGVVICASDRGRFLPANLSELKAYVKRTDAHIRSTSIGLHSARKLLKDWSLNDEFSPFARLDEREVINNGK